MNGLVLDQEGSQVRLEPVFVAPETADQWLHELTTAIPWVRHNVRMFGRDCPAPRLSSWHGDPQASYQYSGIRYQPLPWTPLLTQIRASLKQHLGLDFNAVLLNLYRNGGDRMGWHADDEPELGNQPVIASLSLGAPRDFLLRRKHKPRLPPLRIHLTHGSLLLMSGRTQHDWEHALPARKRVNDARINLTWRQICSFQHENSVESSETLPRAEIPVLPS